MPKAKEITFSVPGWLSVKFTPNEAEQIAAWKKFERAWPGQQCPSELAARLEDIQWKLLAVGETSGERALAPKCLTDTDWRVPGFAGCTSSTGSDRLDGNTSTLAQIAATCTSCEETMALEHALFNALHIVAGYRGDTDELSFPIADGALVAAFVAARER